MKKILSYLTLPYLTLPFLSLLTFLFTNNCYCQVSCSNHNRGMYVDCAGDFIVEAYNGNSAHLDRLLQYTKDACFTHISLYKLDVANVFGDPNLAAILSQFIMECHNSNITVGVVGSTAQFFTDNFVSDPTWTPDYDFTANPAFFTDDQVSSLYPIVNPEADRHNVDLYFAIFVKAEMAKLFLRTGVDYNAYHEGKIDVLSLEDEYWRFAHGDPDEAYTNYTHYIDVLTAMNTIKTCSQSVLGWPLIIEAELGHLNNVDLIQKEISPGIYCTPEYQAEQIDNLTDRILLISYRYYPTELFSKSCQWVNLLGHTTKSNTVIWPTLSAEAYTGSTGVATNVWNSTVVNHWIQNSCNALPGDPWVNYLGDFLVENRPDGLTLAEDEYFNSLGSSPATNCPDCFCTWDNGDNANIDTLMWFAYTLLDDPDSRYHNSDPWYKIRPEANKKSELNYLEITPNPSISDNLKIKYFLGDFKLAASVDIVNFKGELNYSRRLSAASNEFILYKKLIPGIYFCKLTVDGKEYDLQKLVVMP